MNKQERQNAAGAGRWRCDRSGDADAPAAVLWPAARRRRSGRSRSRAPSAPRRSPSRSASPRTCAPITSFVEITVGDPEVADVNPLTDQSLSILGKKNGTTRVSVYAEGKKLIGVFDVEVVYDTSLLQTEIRRRFPHARLRVTAVNGRIMLSGTAPDGPTVDKAVHDRQAVRPGRHQLGQCARSRSRSCSRCASSKPRARPAAISACSGTCSASAISPTSATARRATSFRSPTTERRQPLLAAGRHRSAARTSARRSASRRSSWPACCRAPRRSASSSAS